jgi:dinuclear metal center YbgI/SA1388 family protein
MTSLANILTYLEAFAPAALAADWDNTGLLLGDPKSPVLKVMTCLTLSADVAEEAIEEKCNLIVSHHPILFRAVKKLTMNNPETATVLKLARARVAVYSPHTSFDNCPGGINDILAQMLHLKNVSVLRPKDGQQQFKLVVFTPAADCQAVSEAVFQAGGGCIGQYEQCSFRTAGTGTFYGTEATNPTIGERGQREEVPEFRIEFIVPAKRIDMAVQAVRAAHSYEEPAFDIYALRGKSSGGEGRIGELAEPPTLQQFAKLVKTTCASNTTQFVGDPDKSVQRVAIACGAAGEFLNDAIRAKADVFVTGETRFHDCLAARAAGIGLVLTGHYASERPAVEQLVVRLQKQFPELFIWPSAHERDPLIAV